MGKEHSYHVLKSSTPIFLRKYDDDIINRKNEWNTYHNVKFSSHRISSLVHHCSTNITC